MNILYIIGWPLGQGGHINSSLAITKYLVQQDDIDNIYLLAPKGKKVSYFKNANIKYIRLPDVKNILIFRIFGTLLVLFYSFRYRITHIHIMDYKGLVPALISNIFLRRKIIFTKAGGQPLNVQLPILSALVVFSKELYNHYVKVAHKEQKIELIKERIDFDEFDIVVNDNQMNNEFIIFMAMRLSPSKKSLIDNLFYELSNLKRNNEKIKVVIAGDGELLQYSKSKAQIISEKNSCIIFQFLGQINNNDIIFKHYKKSDITVGHGRGIMEAMALGKPVVLLLFDQRGSTIINETNIDHIAHNNFSGRHFQLGQNSVGLGSFMSLNNCFELMKKLGSFNIDYIRKNYDARVGGQKLKEVYQNAKKQSWHDSLYNLKWVLNKKLRKTN